MNTATARGRAERSGPRGPDAPGRGGRMLRAAGGAHRRKPVTRRQGLTGAWQRGDDDALYRALVDNSPLAVLIHVDARIVFANPRAVALFGGDRREDLVGRLMLDFVAPSGRANAADRLARAALGELVVGHRVPLRRLDGAGVLVELHAAALEPSDEYKGVPAVHVQMWDVTEAVQVEDALRRAAYRDELTGLANRRRLDEALEQAVARSSRNGSPLSVLVCDLDRFKPVNDRFGHAVGDIVLVEMGRRIVSSLRGGDVAARVGGDEFVVVCEQTSAESAALLVGRLRTAVGAPIHVQHKILRLQCSVGTTTTNGGIDPGELLAQADRAMYAHKQRKGEAMPSP